jgi:6-pyruvoyltetrahydropterin/6-carboxytetrahydropterin synthase
MNISITRYHDISCGHRVVGHEGKCRFLHGHNYRIHFTCAAPQRDVIGRVIDFGIVKAVLCEWLENHWDHRMLLWEADPLLPDLIELDPSVVDVPFNPTAENMAEHLIQTVGPSLLNGTNVQLIKVIIEETRKCSAEVSLCC